MKPISLSAADRAIFRLALPGIVSNVTVPLLGLADTAVTGHLGSARELAAIAVGTTVFNMLYWIFSFLRMGTCGLTAQACGQKAQDEARILLLRALAWAFGLGAALILLQRPLLGLALALTAAPGGLHADVALYFRILVWGAPAMLGLYALGGWFVGMQDTQSPMWISIMQNVANIGLTLFFVYGLGGGLGGVACGTLCAQYLALGLGFCFWRRRHAAGAARSEFAGLLRRALSRKELLDGRFLGVGRDLLLRTLCMVAVTVGFTAAGARRGEEVLAANMVLMQFFMLLSYMMDGLAYAGEALCGRFRGAGDKAALTQTIGRLFLWGALFAAAFTALYGIFGQAMVDFLTDVPRVRARCAALLPRVALLPPASLAAFLLDGVFVGLTATRGMFVSMLAASTAFFALVRLCPESDNALWAAFLAYLFLRGAMQAVLLPRLLAEVRR